ncbi:response regulator transcription factor, partial [Meiothermus granaticius]|uniref:response regulator transcription factor n=2 Tax=Meiothermus granaticius TaxID=863370 RepID=UPI002805610F
NNFHAKISAMEGLAKVYSGVLTLELHGQSLLDNLPVTQSVHLVMDAPWGYALWGLRSWPRPVLVVTGNPSPHYLRDLLDLSPDGLVADPIGPSELKEALVRISQGHHFYHLPRLEPDPLCPREREILRLAALGSTNREIADGLGLQAKTVENYMNTLLEKLGLRIRAQIPLYYFGLLESCQKWSGK